MIRFCAKFITLLLCTLFITDAFATASNANILKIDTSATNITTSAYVQLSASTPITTRKVVISNGTSSILLMAIGASGSEVGLFAITATSSLVVELSNTLPAGSRISLEAVSATASSGFVTVSLLN